MNIIKLSPKTQKIFKFLQEWQSEFHLYDLMSFHSMEIYDELEEYNFFGYQTKYFDDRFYAISTECGTGELAFWYYPNLQGEAPIVFLPSSPCEHKLLAGSLNDLVCKIIHRICFNGAWICSDADDGKPLKEPTAEDFNNMYEQVVDRYQQKYNKEISIKKAKELLEEDIQVFKERALKLIDFISEEEIENNIKKHPSFVDRVYQFEFKDYEFYHLNHEIKNEEELLKILNAYKREIKNEQYDTTKEQVIIALKGNYPEYYKSTVFKTWLANVDKPFSEKELKEQEDELKNWIKKVKDENLERNNILIR